MSFSKTLFQEQRIEDNLRDDPDYYIPNELLFWGEVVDFGNG
jgi:hypothetical protein